MFNIVQENFSRISMYKDYSRKLTMSTGWKVYFAVHATLLVASGLLAIVHPAWLLLIGINFALLIGALFIGDELDEDNFPKYVDSGSDVVHASDTAYGSKSASYSCLALLKELLEYEPQLKTFVTDVNGLQQEVFVVLKLHEVDREKVSNQKLEELKNKINVLLNECKTLKRVQASEKLNSETSLLDNAVQTVKGYNG